MKIIKTFVIILLLFLGFVLLKPSIAPKDQVTSLQTPTPSITFQQVTLILDYGNGEKSTHLREYSASQSAFTLLQKITSEQNIPLLYKEYSFGNLVDSINSFQNTKSKSWIYYINSQSATVGADQYFLKPGDLIEWKYTKPQ